MENYILLSSFGYSSNYYITKTGCVYQIEPNKEIPKDKLNRVYIKDNNNKPIRITIKKLYRQAFNKEYCIDNIQSLDCEQWREIPNTNGRYFASNYGRIKSYCGNNAILLKYYTQPSGYLEVTIDGKKRKVHQLVAMCFCENKYKDVKTEVHHKDRNKSNNNANNLEILSIAEHHKLHSKKEVIDNE